jgi:hypothetical protein
MAAAWATWTSKQPTFQCLKGRGFPRPFFFRFNDLVEDGAETPGIAVTRIW